MLFELFATPFRQASWIIPQFRDITPDRFGRVGIVRDSWERLREKNPIKYQDDTQEGCNNKNSGNGISQ